MHVVRLLSPKLENETHTKDIDFSPAGINNRWEAGHADTKRALEQQAWIGEWGLLDGVVLHESRPGAEPASEMEPGKPSGFQAGPHKPRGRIGEAVMVACTRISAIQLFAMVFSFLLAVLFLDVFWVRVAEELHHGDIAGALRKQSWLNAFVALGAAGAAIRLLLWVGSCANGGL